MSPPTTEERIRDLAADAAPVRRVPRPGAVAAVAVALGAGGFALHAALGGPAPRAGALDVVRVLVFAGVALAAGGGLVAGLASAVPGRETAVRHGALVLAVGAALAVGATAWAWIAASGAPPAALPLSVALACALRASALAALPALVAWGFAARAWSARPVRTAALTALGAASVGAAAVHASCTATGARHVLLGHALGPLAVALLVAPPVARWLARRFRAAAA